MEAMIGQEVEIHRLDAAKDEDLVVRGVLKKVIRTRSVYILVDTGNKEPEVIMIKKGEIL